MLEFCRGLFPVVSYGYTTIPTYPSGQIGFILCSNNKVSYIVKHDLGNLMVGRGPEMILIQAQQAKGGIHDNSESGNY